nr:hypothetical protein Iba_chr05dCG4270 [Ipomoea batatas]
MGDKTPCREQKFLCMLQVYLSVIANSGSYACKCALNIEESRPAISNLLFSDHSFATGELRSLLA